MDANKKEVLKNISYRVNPCCGLCVHGQFKKSNDFGECDKITYSHLKHTDDQRPLSINRMGWCPWFKMNESKKAFLHGFTEFMAS